MIWKKHEGIIWLEGEMKNNDPEGE